MAKSSGLGWSALSVDDAGNVQRDIRTDLTNIQFATPRGVYDWTGIDKSAYERAVGLADFTITMNGIFDPAANQAHDVFKTIPSTSVSRLITMTANGKTLAPTCILTDYGLTRATDGNYAFAVPGSLSSGVVPTWS